MDAWKRTVLVAGGVGGAAALLYCLLRDDSESDSRAAGRSGGAAAQGAQASVSTSFTKDKVLQILSEILEMQDKMKVGLKAVTKDLIATDRPFEDTYEKIKEMQPEDVLDKYGITMEIFDKQLMEHQADPQVREGIMKIMGEVPGGAAGRGMAKNVSPQQLVDAHKVMLSEMSKILQLVNASKNKKFNDPKSLALTAQVLVAAKVEDKCKLTAEDMEAALMENQQALGSNQEFMEVTMKMQSAMSELVGM